MLYDVLAFIGLYTISWPFLLILFFTGIIFEHTKCHGWAVFTGLVAMTISYFYFDVSLLVVAQWAFAYVGIGIAWSFWRYHSHVSSEVEKLKEACYEPYYLKAKVEELSPGKNIDLITIWVIIWPFSAVENIVGDVIDVIRALVTKVFKSVYSKIYASHVSIFDDKIKSE